MTRAPVSRSSARLAAALAGGVLALAGCQTPGEKRADEDAEVAARCTPVKDLLSKNYHREGRLDLAVVSGGGVLSRTGVVLTGAEASRLAQLDYFCRAWVKGALSDAQYAQAILPVFATTVADTAAGQSVAAIAGSNAAGLDALKQQQIVPEALETQQLQGYAEAAAGLPADQRQAQLTSQLGGISAVLRLAADGELQFQASVLTRLDDLERILKPQGAASGPSGDPAAPRPPAPPLRGLDLYFSTGSAELAYDSRQRLRDAAAGWVQQSRAVTVTGFADGRGRDELNRALSAARARAVAQELERAGVDVTAVRGAGVKPGADLDLARTVRIEVTEGGGSAAPS